MSIMLAEKVRKLKIDDRVEYKSGNGKSRIEALAEVTHEPGSWSVSVRLIEIRRMGSEVQLSEGQEVIARFQEIFTLQYQEPTLEQKIASRLHSKLCHSNHDFVCTWYSTSWNKPDWNRLFYLKMAKNILDKACGDEERAWERAKKLR